MSYSSPGAAPRQQGGLPIAYLLAGASTVIVLAIVAVMMLSGGGGGFPNDPDAAIKAARSYMITHSRAYVGKRSLMDDTPPTAKKVSDGFMVYGKVGFRPDKGKPPPFYEKWEAKVRYDTVKKVWMVQDFKP